MRAMFKGSPGSGRAGAFLFFWKRWHDVQDNQSSEDSMRRIAMAAVWLLLPVSLCAQWLDWRTPGIPRTPDGKPNLTAPVPRTPDGKTDLSGMWQPEINPYRFSVIQD